MYFHMHKKDFFTSFFDASDEFDEDREIWKIVHLLMDWMLCLKLFGILYFWSRQMAGFLFCHKVCSKIQWLYIASIMLSC